jgi:hypothetical protein
MPKSPPGAHCLRRESMAGWVSGPFAVIGVPAKRQSDHSAKAESAADPPRKRRCMGPGWRRASALTVFIRLREENERPAFEELPY